MKYYELDVEQFIDQPVEKVFEFFSRPENLEEITPPRLGFTIMTPSPIPMEKGSLIDYTIRILGFSVHWRTLITSYDPPHGFVDEQIKGPYVLWHHRHSFKKENGGTIIRDTVRYAVLLGIIGRFLNLIWIQKDLKDIFAYRRKFIANKFGEQNYDLSFHKGWRETA